MRLFLASRVRTPGTMEHLSQYVGGFKNKKIAYIPTAANAERGWNIWRTEADGTWEYINTLEAKIEAVILEDYRNDSVISGLIDSDIIWVGGGMAGYLMYWMRRCGLDLFLKKTDDNGPIYVGSSAGSMVTGQSLAAASWSFTDGERGAEDIKAMGLVDFDIFPHYDQNYLTDIKKSYKKGKLYLLKDGEEIIVEKGEVSLTGESRIIVNDR